MTGLSILKVGSTSCHETSFCIFEKITEIIKIVPLILKSQIIQIFLLQKTFLLR